MLQRAEMTSTQVVHCLMAPPGPSALSDDQWGQPFVVVESLLKTIGGNTDLLP